MIDRPRRRDRAFAATSAARSSSRNLDVVGTNGFEPERVAGLSSDGIAPPSP
jgi:hypothetical protein